MSGALCPMTTSVLTMVYEDNSILLKSLLPVATKAAEEGSMRMSGLWVASILFRPAQPWKVMLRIAYDSYTTSSAPVWSNVTLLNDKDPAWESFVSGIAARVILLKVRSSSTTSRLGSSMSKIKGAPSTSLAARSENVRLPDICLNGSDMVWVALGASPVVVMLWIVKFPLNISQFWNSFVRRRSVISVGAEQVNSTLLSISHHSTARQVTTYEHRQG